ncbi:aspartate carbamoyltransferase catalytic subunit [Canibacter sp. lx-72]|uniref:aspartate carbamoyltransferase catalytic subunit n=1 Tax=Canibacter zhuwentaonis TaxID=2837491 RepID=UPI001BDD86AD|nr:aspartate carbamoyltransferase catalytic subunit [Canibacter zhuwentaonis]
MQHLLHTQDLSRADAIALLDSAAGFARQKQHTGSAKTDLLGGKKIINLFFEDSTRTKISFETAAKNLGAEVLSFSARGSSVSKGESLKDTAQTLQAMGADAMVIRHWASGAAHKLAHSCWVNCAVLNAGDGTHEHPTQALLDAYTIRQRLRLAASPGQGLDGVRVVIVGDILHSRVARSNMWLLSTLGASVTFVAPATLLPFGVAQMPARVSHSLDEALAEKPDVVMLLRVQHERMRAGFFPSIPEYVASWGLTAERFAALPDSTLIMHPGPVNRGVEICSAAVDAAQTSVLEQVENGVFVRMAALAMLLKTGLQEVS